MNKKKFLGIFTLIFSILLVAVGAASFVITKDYSMSTSIDPTTGDKAVCFLTTTPGDSASFEYFVSIDDAVTEANTRAKDTSTRQYVYTIPATTRGECTYTRIKGVGTTKKLTINSNVVLTLPIPGTSYSVSTSDAYNQYGWPAILNEGDYNDTSGADGHFNEGEYTFADSSAEMVAAYRRTLVYIEPGVELVISSNGALQIGGYTSCATRGDRTSEFGGLYTKYFSNSFNGLTGHTSNVYSEILLGEGAKITHNGGYLNCYGYIKEGVLNSNNTVDYVLGYENSSVDSKSGTAKVPFVIYDYQGLDSSFFLINSDNKITPFRIYDIPNIQCKFNVYSGATLRGLARLEGYYRLTIEVSQEVRIIANATPSGTNSVAFTLNKLNTSNSQSAYVTIKYNSETPGYTTNDVVSRVNNSTNLNETEVVLNTNSKLDLGYIYITIPGSTMLEILRLPSYINTADMHFPFNYKFNFTIRSGSQINVNYNTKFLPGSRLIVEEGATVNINATAIFYDSTFSQQNEIIAYPSNVGIAYASIGGTLNISSQGGMGGVVYTTSLNAVLSNSGSSSANSYERGSKSGLTKYNPVTINRTLIGYSDTSMSSYNTLNQKVYFSSNGNSGQYWNAQQINLTISTSSSSSIAQKGTTIEYTSTINYPSSMSIDYFTWSISNTYGVTSSNTTSISRASWTIGSNEENNNRYYTVSLTVVFGYNGIEIPLTATGNQLTQEGTCLSGEVDILLADGTYKKLKDLTYEDEIYAWNLFDGELSVTTPSILFKHEETEYNVVDMKFSDGTTIEVLNEHEFFDLDLNSFVLINPRNYRDYIGHKFAHVDITKGVSYYDGITFVSADCYTKVTTAYSLQSAIYNNFISNDLISLTPPAYIGWFDYFEIGENLKYDEEKMNADIEKYGLYEYEVFEPYGVTYEQFIAFNGPYLKVLVGRGVVTFDQIIELIYSYVV